MPSHRIEPLTVALLVITAVVIYTTTFHHFSGAVHLHARPAPGSAPGTSAAPSRRLRPRPASAARTAPPPAQDAQLSAPSSSPSPPSASARKLGLVASSSVSSAAGLFKIYGEASDCGDPTLRLMLDFRYCYRRGSTDVVRTALEAVGMTEVRADVTVFEVVWGLADEMNRGASGVSYVHWQHLLPFQRVNHLPGIGELGFKSKLQRNLASAADRFGADQYDFFPRSFAVPAEMPAFSATFKEIALARQTKAGAAGVVAPAAEQLWIMKSVMTDRGEGIRLIRSLDQVRPPGASSDAEIPRSVMQQYVQKPYLLNGYKATLRVYVLCVSLDPLRLYVYDDGFVHMATEKYDPDPRLFGRKYMHLTNPDVHKHREAYHRNPRPFYWSIKEMLAYVDKQSGGAGGGTHGAGAADAPSQRLWRDIRTVMAKTFLAVEPKLVARARKHIPHGTANGFELLGMDILVDESLHPWLLEVNPDPDLTASKGFELAQTIKVRMLRDVFTLLGFASGGGAGGGAGGAGDAAAAAAAAAHSQGRSGRQQQRDLVVHLASSLLHAARNGASSPAALTAAADLLLSLRPPGLPPPRSNCVDALTAGRCHLRDSDDANMVALSEIEYARSGGFERAFPVVPAKGSSSSSSSSSSSTSKSSSGGSNGALSNIEVDQLLGLQFIPRRSDSLLACWEREMARCGMRDRRAM